LKAPRKYTLPLPLPLLRLMGLCGSGMRVRANYPIGKWTNIDIQGTMHCTGWRRRTTVFATSCVLISRTSMAPVAMPRIQTSRWRPQVSAIQWSRSAHTLELQV